MTIFRALLVLVCAGALSACGKMGDLERPGPGAGRVATPARQDPNRPVRTIDPRHMDEPVTPAPAPAISTPTTPATDQ